MTHNARCLCLVVSLTLLGSTLASPRASLIEIRGAASGSAEISGVSTLKHEIVSVLDTLGGSLANHPVCEAERGAGCPDTPLGSSLMQKQSEWLTARTVSLLENAPLATDSAIEKDASQTEGGQWTPEVHCPRILFNAKDCWRAANPKWCKLAEDGLKKIDEYESWACKNCLECKNTDVAAASLLSEEADQDPELSMDIDTILHPEKEDGDDDILDVAAEVPPVCHDFLRSCNIEVSNGSMSNFLFEFARCCESSGHPRTLCAPLGLELKHKHSQREAPAMFLTVDFCTELQALQTAHKFWSSDEPSGALVQSSLLDRAGLYSTHRGKSHSFDTSLMQKPNPIDEAQSALEGVIDEGIDTLVSCIGLAAKELALSYWKTRADNEEEDVNKVLKEIEDFEAQVKKDGQACACGITERCKAAEHLTTEKALNNKLLIQKNEEAEMETKVTELQAEIDDDKCSTMITTIKDIVDKVKAIANKIILALKQIVCFAIALALDFVGEYLDVKLAIMFPTLTAGRTNPLCADRPKHLSERQVDNIQKACWLLNVEAGAELMTQNLSLQELGVNENHVTGEVGSFFRPLRRANGYPAIAENAFTLFLWICSKSGNQMLMDFAASDKTALISFIIFRFMDVLCGNLGTAIISFIKELVFCNLPELECAIPDAMCNFPDLFTIRSASLLSLATTTTTYDTGPSCSSGSTAPLAACYSEDQIPGWSQWSGTANSDVFYYKSARLSGNHDSMVAECAAACEGLGYTQFDIHDTTACFCGKSTMVATSTGTGQTTGCKNYLYKLQQASLLSWTECYDGQQIGGGRGIGDAGALQAWSDCSNFGFATMAACQERCASVANCYAANYDPTQQMCGAVGYCYIVDNGGTITPGAWNANGKVCVKPAQEQHDPFAGLCQKWVYGNDGSQDCRSFCKAQKTLQGTTGALVNDHYNVHKEAPCCPAGNEWGKAVTCGACLCTG